jgi:hypothetical protein
VALRHVARGRTGSSSTCSWPRLGEDMSLKDGTAYNVQFVGSRPTFVDTGSFEPSTGRGPYRQFCGRCCSR